MSNKYNLVVLDGFTLNPGDLSWDSIRAFGSCDIYDRTATEETIDRSKDVAIALTNKVIFNESTLNQLPN